MHGYILALSLPIIFWLWGAEQLLGHFLQIYVDVV